MSPAPQPQCEHWFRLFRFRSPLLTESSFLSFPPGTEMFHFPGLALFRVMESRSIGLPHSDIHDYIAC